MRKVVIGIFVALIIWMFLNLLSWTYLGYQLQQLKIENLSKSKTTINHINSWIKWHPYISFGTHRLPYIYPMFQLLNLSVNTAEIGQHVVDQVTPIAKNSLTANSIDQKDIQQLFDSIPEIIDHLDQIQHQLEHPQISKIAKAANKQAQLNNVVEQVNNLNHQLIAISQNQSAIIQLLGYGSPQHFVVLLQNNMELWPTGGYMGSYAEFWLDQGAVKDLTVEAIDVPNGQIKGYVEAPEPITKYSHQGGTPGWRLRASNWNPDFPEGMPTIDWFFTQGGVKPIDTLIAVNLIPIIDFIDNIGGLELIDYDVTLNSENFYLTTQEHTSYNFFPGSTQKRDFLGYVSRQLLFKLTSDPSQYILPLSKTIIKNISTNQIIFSSKHESIQSMFNSLNWDGGVDSHHCQQKDQNCIPDYLHINETNLGINKTNCCIDRQFSLSTRINPDEFTVSHQLDLQFFNHNPSTPQPPEKWGGGYLTYIRLYMPENSVLENIIDSKEGEIDPKLIDKEYIKDKLVVGFPILVPGQQQNTFSVKYQIIPPEKSLVADSYQLRLHKQSGINSIPFNISITDGNTTQTHQLEFDRDTTLTFPLQNQNKSSN